jgi:two-component system sensor histidine kinase BarA
MVADTPRVRRTITFKLGCLVSAAVAVAVLTIGLATAWHEIGRFAEGRREALLATATVFSAAVAKPVVAGDARAVRLALRAIGRVPGAVEAEVYAAGGSLIADLGGAARLADDIDLTAATDAALNLRLLTSETVKVVVPIIDSGAEVGKLVLISETGDLMSELGDLLLGLLGAGALALAIGLGISLKLQRGITRPLVSLAAKMSMIRESHDYRSSIEVRGSDETAVLASSFNAMISEILERDRALVRHQQHLENEVAERTQDLSLAKLAAEQANEAKSTFLATMSHEIRTPMNGMLAMAELLATSDLPSRQRRYAEVIARSGQSLVAIINDILDLSKVEAGKMEIESAPISIADVVDTVIALFGERAHGKALDLAAFVSAEIPDRCLGDQVRLTQILSNLVNNALKFTERGHVLVRVVRVDGMIRIEVADTGIGIPADKLDQIFSSFTQAEQSTARRFGGTGLGLSICKKLVEAMGGAIGVDSRMGSGSTFWVKLPIEGEVQAAARNAAQSDYPVLIASRRSAVLGSMLGTFAENGLIASERALADAPPAFWIADAVVLLERGRRPTGALAVIAIAAPGSGSEDDVLARGLADRVLGWPVSQAELRPLVAELAAGRIDKQAQPASRKAAPTATRFDSAKVLVADDSAVNREVAAEALRRFGIVAETVEDGQAAMEAILSRRFDLVLMDGSMPVLDGFEATRRVRELEAQTGRSRTPIVALTAHVLGAQASEWSEAGMDDVLHKPLSMIKLEQCLKQWITGETAAAAADESQAAPEDRDELLSEETLLQLEDMSGGGEAFIQRVFALFSAQSSRLAAALEGAVAQGDFGETARLAHALKSTSLNIGALALANRAAGIELSARESGALPEAGEVDALRGLLRDSEAALSNRLNVTVATSAAA